MEIESLFSAVELIILFSPRHGSSSLLFGSCLIFHGSSFNTPRCSSDENFEFSGATAPIVFYRISGYKDTIPVKLG